MQPHEPHHGKDGWHMLHVDQDMDHWLASRFHKADEAFPDPILVDLPVEPMLGDH